MRRWTRRRSAAQSTKFIILDLYFQESRKNFRASRFFASAPRKVSNRQRKYGLFQGLNRYPRATFQ
jgi:hypothetical protein